MVLYTRLLILCVSLFTSAHIHAAVGQSKWSSSVSINGNIGSSIAYDASKQHLYIGSGDGVLHAIDGSGSAIWSFYTEGVIGSTPALNTDSSVVYVSSFDHKLYAIETQSGQVLWSFDTGATLYSSPAIGSDGTLYVGADNGYLFAIDPSTGTEKWHFDGGSAIGSSPAIGHNGYVYFGNKNGALYALDPNDFIANPSSNERWKYVASSGMSSPAIGLDGTVYVGGFDKTLYALDGLSGAKKWERLLGGKITSSPIVDRTGTVYVTSYENGSLNAVTSQGVLLWALPLTDDGKAIYSSPTIGDNHIIYVGTFGGRVIAVNPALYTASNLSLMKTWNYSTSTPIISSPLLAPDNTLYLASLDGQLHAIETDSTSTMLSAWPMFGSNLHRGSVPSDKDSDSDGMADSWEEQYSLNISSDDSGLDLDNDSLSNLQEFYANTNPTVSDTDNDGMPDGWELAYSLNPLVDDSGLDSDGDGKTNLQEFADGSNPSPTENSAPIAVADAAITLEDNPVTIDVLTNDSDSDGDALTITAVTGSTNGSVVNNQGNDVIYVPSQHFNGNDSFTYSVSDGKGGSDEATVNVVISAVNDEPEALNDNAVIAVAGVTINVLSNDSDVDGDTLSIESYTQPSYGTVSIESNALRYTPNSSDISNDDNFTYTIADGQGGFSTANVSLDGVSSQASKYQVIKLGGIVVVVPIK
jgi:outer membrane protein assembly factor BamB